LLFFIRWTILITATYMPRHPIEFASEQSFIFSLLKKSLAICCKFATLPKYQISSAFDAAGWVEPGREAV